MRSKIFYLIPLTISILLLNSCVSKEAKFNFFFTNVQNSIEKTKLDSFRNAPFDSVDSRFSHIYIKLRNLYEDTLLSESIIKYLDSIDVNPLYEVRGLYLEKAFHSFLNKKPINNKEIFISVKKRLDYNKLKWKKKKKYYKNKSWQLAQLNFNSFTIGDTISFNLPVTISEEYKIKSTFYFDGLPNSSNYSNIDDSLIGKGILINKWTENALYPNLDSVFVFDVKLIELSDTITLILQEKKTVGDTMELFLIEYGRKL